MRPLKPMLLILQARLALARFGWLNTVSIAMMLMGAIGGAWLLSYLRIQATAPLRSLHRAQQSLKEATANPDASTRSQLEERLAAFYDVMGEKRYAEQQIKTLFAIASKNGLTLNQAEYRAAVDKPSRIMAYQITLPVKGNYAAVRRFCEQTLIAIPFASLDDIGFKRDTVGNSTLEARLRFTLYLGDGGPVVQATPETAASMGSPR